MRLKEFFNLKFPTWIEIQRSHENHTSFIHIISARKPTSREKRKYAFPTAIIEFDFFIEQMYKSKIRQFHVSIGQAEENILEQTEIFDSKRRRVLPKFMRKLTVGYIFEKIGLKYEIKNSTMV